MNDICQNCTEISGLNSVGINDNNLEIENVNNCLKFISIKSDSGVESKSNQSPWTDLPKKLPTAFISSEDWGLYLRICCHIRQINANETNDLNYATLGIKNKRKNRCLIRLIAAFNKLYAEYSTIYDLWKRASLKQDDTADNDDSNNGKQQLTSIPRPKSNLSTADEHGSNSKLNLVDSVVENKDLDTTLSQEENPGEECSNPDDDRRTINPAQSRQRRQSLRSFTGERVGLTDEQTASIFTLVNSNSTSLGFIQGRSMISSPQTPVQQSQSPMLSSDSEHVTCFQWCTGSADHKQIKSTKHLSVSGNNQYSKQCYHSFGKFDHKTRAAVHDLDSIGTYYDQIRRDPIENTIPVYQTFSFQQKTEHRTQIYSNWFDFKSNRNYVGELNMKIGNKVTATLRLPIALELILPRMQKQIEEIMNCCQYIYDPLEVACELRETNYDTKACVAFFEKTRSLREIIEEFLPATYMEHDNLTKSKYSRSSNRMTENHHNMVSCTPVTNRMSSCLTDLRNQIVYLKKIHADATRRLERARILILGMVDKIVHTLQDRINLMYGSTPCLSLLIQGDIAHESLSRLNQLTEENKLLKLTLRMEENRRKTIFNMMQEYLGNIRVYCRCRFIPNTTQCIQIGSMDTLVLTSNMDNMAEQFRFDRVFDGNAHQTDIYAEMAPAICSFLDGYNVCFLAYGGEASGKTYTLLGHEHGSEETHGLVYRSLRTILTEIEIRRNEWIYQFSVAVIEVYNDTLIDLLNDEPGIHVRVDLGLAQMIARLKTMKIDTQTDIDQLLAICRTRRRTGRTALNSKSSRSHLIILTQLCARNRIYDTTEISSVLALCDLAGFEDIIKAETLTDPILAKEAGYINRSLTALNRVFMTLRSQDPSTVSYRDSKLTYLLKPFFTLSGKCILITTIRTDKANLASTQSTLRFGRDSRGVNLGRAKRQLNLDKLLDGIRTG